MARNITDIKKGMTDKFISQAEIITAYNLDVNKTFEDQFSVISIESILFYVVAFCVHSLEVIFDIFKYDTDNNIKEKNPHTTEWWAQLAKAYQHGFSLLPDSHLYDSSAYSDTEIEASNIVKYAAVVEQQNIFGRMELRIKLAKKVGDGLGALSITELNGVKAYFKRVGDAGVKLKIDSLPPDSIQMEWNIFYDPLLLDGNGNRNDGTASDVIAIAVKQYLENLPFNGTLVLAYMTDAVQSVEGVVYPEIIACKTKYGTNNYQAVHNEYLPDAGYLRFENTSDLIINYFPRTAIQ
jgi:hypothetical protein